MIRPSEEGEECVDEQTERQREKFLPLHHRGHGCSSFPPSVLRVRPFVLDVFNILMPPQKSSAQIRFQARSLLSKLMSQTRKGNAVQHELLRLGAFSRVGVTDNEPGSRVC